MQTLNKITPFLWFDGNLEEALNFYLSVFKDAKKRTENRMGDKLFTASFEVDGQEFMMLDGGPMYKFNPAVSFFVNCSTQDEIDYYWKSLIADTGNEESCGWLVDKYGVSWQIVPDMLGSVLWSKENPEAASRAMKAMMKMKKMDIQALKDAFADKTATTSE